MTGHEWLLIALVIGAYALINWVDSKESDDA